MATIAQDIPSLDEIENTEYKVIGTRPIRHDGADKVTGRAIYGADIHLTGLLYGKMLRSPHAHARIISIDTSAAEALPGVKAVITCDDMPTIASKIEDVGESVLNMRDISNRLLAHGKVFFQGHGIAAVAATNAHIAEEATQLIKVEYEVLEPVLDAREAMKPGAPILHDDLCTDEMGKELEGPTNVAQHLQHQRGDLAKGFAEADLIVEREFLTGTVHQGYIEPQNATALWNDDDHIFIWCSTQGAHPVRNQVSDLLEVPVSQITVTPLEIGGGFGGKIDVYLEPIAAVLSRKSGHHPVKMIMTRAEVLTATGPTSGSYMRVKMGAKNNGEITAAEVYMAYEAGGFPGSPIGAGATTILAPYRLENLQIDGYDVLVNRPKSAAYRAPGATNAAFASETVIDELAEKLGIDPLDMRLLNGVVEGDRRPDGPIYGRVGFLETVQAAKDHSHYRTPLEGPYRGRGVASGYWTNWGGKSSVSASVSKDGTVNLVEGSTDIGGTRASIAMQLAETLGLTAQDVNPRVVDTDTVGYNDVTGGSRTTFTTGYAAYLLGKKLQQEMAARAADYWDVDPAQVKVDGAVYSHNGDSMTFKELAQEADRHGEPVTAAASVAPENYGGAFGTHIVDLEVDPETGKVTILRYTAVQDVGKAIHPAYVEGQMQGAAAQGIGWALNEEYVYDDEGHMLNASLLDYRMPTALDLPMIDTELVEVANPTHPYGVRGVGEVPIVPPAAAVANAIYRAIGVRLDTLPMSPPHVAEALWEKA